jgi:hypothetical protein
VFTGPKIVRCKKCKRLFSDYADRCPECHTKTPRGWARAIIPLICIAIALAALAWTYHALSNRPDAM